MWFIGVRLFIGLRTWLGCVVISLRVYRPFWQILFDFLIRFQKTDCLRNISSVEKGIVYQILLGNSNTRRGINNHLY